MSDTGPWNYILVFSSSVGTREQVKEFIDSREEILTWYLCMSHAIFIRSNQDATGLQKIFKEFTRDRGRFIILDCQTDRNGWLPKNAWAFLRGEYP